MKILIYADIDNEACYRLEEQIWELLNQVRVSLFVHSIPSLFNEIGHPKCDFSVLIFCPNGKENLQTILNCEQKFEDLKKIIILPNDDQEVASLAKELQPSFMCHAENSSDHVLAALNKMTINSSSTTPVYVEC